MGKRIMIIDDSMRSRLELKDLLLSHGFSVCGELSNGRDAIDKYEKLQPDVVMIDARMPDMDGACTTRVLLEKDPEAKIVICAGSGEKSTVMEALTLGAIDFIAKPYVPLRLVQTLRRALSGVSPR
jgi:two-component system chemotaxis response regulator CheY